MPAPSSLQTIPSGIAISTATIQPNIAWGPPSADIRSGIVMKGPTPIMFDMFRAVACTSPKRLSSGSPSVPTFRKSDAMEIIETSFEAHIISEHDILQGEFYFCLLVPSDLVSCFLPLGPERSTKSHEM